MFAYLPIGEREVGELLCGRSDCEKKITDLSKLVPVCTSSDVINLLLFKIHGVRMVRMVQSISVPFECLPHS